MTNCKRRWRALAMSLCIAAPPLAAAASFPDWAFPGCPERPAHAAQDDAQAVSVPGSSRSVTRRQTRQADVTVDWFPQEHAPLPGIVATQPGKAGCGYCHLPDGAGRPENAKLAGLPAAYIIAQVRALHSGDRTAVRPDWDPTRYMVEFSAGIDDADIAAAAHYFAANPPRSYVRVVETAYVPDPVVRCYTYGPGNGARARLGARIIEVPEDFERFELRDPHTPYVAYVPVGSVGRGGRLASGAAGTRTMACAGCHGAGLAGDAKLPGPPLAGRFPGYLFRQLYGFKAGARSGAAAAPMREVVAGLSDRDMIDLAAYVASLPP